jgi:glutaminase
LDEEFQKANKSLFITDYHHLELLAAMPLPQPSFLQFPELNDAVLHLEKTILHANGYRPKQEPVQLVDQQLLAGLTETELCYLSRHIRHRKFNAGEVIINKGSTAYEIFFLESGQVVVQDYNGDHKDVTIAVINAGNSFGEMALLDKQKRSANVVAQTNVSCFVMLYDVLDSMECLATIRVKILTNLAASLSYRLRIANKEIASFT